MNSENLLECQIMVYMLVGARTRTTIKKIHFPIIFLPKTSCSWCDQLPLARGTAAESHPLLPQRGGGAVAAPPRAVRHPVPHQPLRLLPQLPVPRHPLH